MLKATAISALKDVLRQSGIALPQEAPALPEETQAVEAEIVSQETPPPPDATADEPPTITPIPHTNGATTPHPFGEAMEGQ